MLGLVCSIVDQVVIVHGEGEAAGGEVFGVGVVGISRYLQPDKVHLMLCEAERGREGERTYRCTQ